MSRRAMEVNEKKGFGKTTASKQRHHKNFLRASKKFPKLHQLWAMMVGFSEIAEDISASQALKFWKVYWEDAAGILGQIDISNSECYFWLTRLKGITLFTLERLYRSLGESLALEFIAKSETPFARMGETTIEIGLAWKEGHIIYGGQSLIVYRGKDTSTAQGELMVAVRHITGCWSHYPFPDNMPVPLSDYKNARLALKGFPQPLQGELSHPQSSKLAQLLGLTIKGDYAYLVKS